MRVATRAGARLATIRRTVSLPAEGMATMTSWTPCRSMIAGRLVDASQDWMARDLAALEAVVQEAHDPVFR